MFELEGALVYQNYESENISVETPLKYQIHERPLTISKNHERRVQKKRAQACRIESLRAYRYHLTGGMSM